MEQKSIQKQKYGTKNYKIKINKKIWNRNNKHKKQIWRKYGIPRQPDIKVDAKYKNSK